MTKPVLLGAAILTAGAAGVGWWRTHAIGPVERGWRLASRHGCLSCHGSAGRPEDPHPAGTGGAPSFSHEDVTEYARDESKIREWIRDGKPRRLRENPVAAFFLERQLVRMPAFGPEVTDDEIEQIETYIAWLRRRPAVAEGDADD